MDNNNHKLRLENGLGLDHSAFSEPWIAANVL
jgi:hypothetical protein